MFQKMYLQNGIKFRALITRTLQTETVDTVAKATRFTQLRQTSTTSLPATITKRLNSKCGKKEESNLAVGDKM